MTKKTCIFDFDGVLCNSREVGYEMHNRIAKKYGLPLINKQSDFLQVIDNGHLKDTLDADTISQYYIECNKYYESKLKDIHLFPFMEQLLKEEDVIILSACPDFMIKTVLKQHGITTGVDIYGKEKARTKRDRFELVLKERSLKKDDIIYIGDTIDDYHFCQSVGIPMIGSNYGYSNLDEIRDSLQGIMTSDEELYQKIKTYRLVR